MTIRHCFAASTAMVAVAIATPAVAAQEMSYEQQTYEFAQPLPTQAPQPTFTSNPVVQPIPARTSYPTGYDAYDQDVAIEAPVEYHGSTAPVAHTPGTHVETVEIEQAPYPMEHHAGGHQATGHHAMPHHGAVAYPAHGAPQPAYGGPPLPSQQSFDRSGWLDQCESELRARKNRGAVGGGLLGAIAGGVIGNRVADGERLGGTLLGAGLGGIAGAAIGSAIGSAVGGNPYLRECKDYLENWERGGYQQGGYGYGYGYGQQGYYGHHGYGYGYAQAYTYVPAIAYVTTYQLSRPVVKEYVTEEWVDVPVEHYEYETVVEHKPVHREVQYIKQQPVRPIKYIKGK